MLPEKHAYLLRTEDYLEQVERFVTEAEELRAEEDQRLVSRLHVRLRQAWSLVERCREAPSTAWMSSKNDLADVIARIIIDVGCLRVTSGRLMVSAR